MCFPGTVISGALIAGLVPLEQPEVSAMLEGAVMIRENRDLNNTQFPWSHLVDSTYNSLCQQTRSNH